VRKTIDKANKLIQMFLGRHKLPRIHTQTHETSAAINLFIYIGQFTWPRAPNFSSPHHPVCLPDFDDILHFIWRAFHLLVITPHKKEDI